MAEVGERVRGFNLEGAGALGARGSYCFIVRRFDGRMILRIEPQENIAAQFEEGRIAPGLAGLFRQRQGVVTDSERGLRIAGCQFESR